MRTYGWLAMVLALVSCTTANPAYDPNPELPGECRSGTEISEVFSEYRRPELLDILFVIDASGDDTEALQELFANAVGPLGALLRDLDLDARVAVARTGGGATLAGPGLAGPGCEGNSEVVADLSDDDWARVLRCNLLLGSGELTFGHPLAVIDGLLAEPPEGFLREDAKLLFVVVTREDDCSSESELSGLPREGCREAPLIDVDELTQRWRQTYDGVALAVFAGAPSELDGENRRRVCSSTVGSAQAANRLFEATEHFDEHGYFHSVCTDDVFRPLASVLANFVDSGTVTVCPESPLAHEPLSVVADGNEPIPWGESGFIYMGETELCGTGAIRFAGDVLRGLDEVEIVYCTPEQ